VTSIAVDQATTSVTLHSRIVRAASVAGIRAAVTAEAAKIARRVPDLVVTVYDAPWCPIGDDGDPIEVRWCATHRIVFTGDCFARDPQTDAPCYHAPVRASTIEVRAVGLPICDGWRVAGVLTRDTNGVLAASSVGVTEDGWASAHLALMGQCVHCGKVRHRNTTVLLVNDDTGEVRPVGKTCLGEYTGGAIRAEIIAVLTTLGERFRQLSEGVIESEEDCAPTVDVVALATRYIALHGFVRSGETGPHNSPCTANLVRFALNWNGKGSRPEVGVQDLTDADREQARADIGAVLAEDPDGDYMVNLQAAASAEWAQATGRRNKIGLLASLPGAAARIAERSARAQADAASERVNAWIGEPRQRRMFTGTLVTARAVETAFGVSDLVVIDTSEGTVKIFGVAAGIDRFEAGEEIVVLGTITEHDEYQGHRQTRISRVKIAPKA
jgi:hypothetical protein